MSDLPDRDDFLANDYNVRMVAEAWRRGDLKSRDEMDEEAAYVALRRWVGIGVADRFVRAAVPFVLDAAFGVDDG